MAVTVGMSPGMASMTSMASEEEEEDLDPDAGLSEDQVRDKLTGQLRLFDDEE